MKEENCPCCSNHCPKDNLSCGRGVAHFSNTNNESEINSIEEQVVADLRKCGHMLHHSHDVNPEELLSNLTDDELQKLHELLSKIEN